METTDLAYLAGLIDGDGSIIAQFVPSGGRHDYKFKYQIRLTIQISQLKKRMWLLKQLQDMIGAGTIRVRSSNSRASRSETEDMADFILVGPPVESLLKQLQPYLKVKQKQANLVLKIAEQLPTSRQSAEGLVKLGQLVERVAALNDSKNRKITLAVVAATLGVAIIVDVPVETSDTVDTSE